MKISAVIAKEMLFSFHLIFASSSRLIFAPTRCRISFLVLFAILGHVHQWQNSFHWSILKFIEPRVGRHGCGQSLLVDHLIVATFLVIKVGRRRNLIVNHLLSYSIVHQTWHRSSRQRFAAGGGGGCCPHRCGGGFGWTQIGLGCGAAANDLLVRYSQSWGESESAVVSGWRIGWRFEGWR